MSEYQYYEFAAIDRPLTAAEMAQLRKVSTRGQVSTSGFVNQYEWGGLKADPADWTRRYFDAFVYTANWCSCRLSLRVPLGTFGKAELKPFAAGGALTMAATDEHWIIDWSLDDSENHDRFGMEDGSGWMGRLAPLRDELLRGDLRPLYLGWLASAGEFDDDVLEPEPPAGLSDLTPAQRALTEFIEIDPDLLAAAASGSPRATPNDSAQEAERRQQREAVLRLLMADVDLRWTAVDTLAGRGSASGYGQAVRALTDLAEGYVLTSSRKEFDRALRSLLVRHATRGALLRRLTEAGLWSG